MNQKHPFLAIEDLYLAQQVAGASILGERLAGALWMAKDMEPGSPEMQKIAERVDKRLAQLREEGQKPRVELMVEERDTKLDIHKALEQAGEQDARPAASTGGKDLDATIAQLMVNGAKLEELVSAKRLRAAVEAMHEPEGFEPVDPLPIDSRMPFADQLETLRSDMRRGVEEGLRPFDAFTLSVGALVLVVGEGESERRVPLIRQQMSTSPERVGSHLLDIARDVGAHLREANEVFKARLASLPENWPSPEGWAVANAAREERFNGDSDVPENEFYNGAWPSGVDIHRRSEELLEMQRQSEAGEAPVAPLAAIGSRLEARKGAKAAAAEGAARPSLGRL